MIHRNRDEADTRILFHLDHLDLIDPVNSVRVTDSDVAVMLLPSNKVDPLRIRHLILVVIIFTYCNIS